jgi:hypothetical protein
LTKGRDQENYLSRPLVTSVKRPWVYKTIWFDSKATTDHDYNWHEFSQMRAASWKGRTSNNHGHIKRRILVSFEWQEQTWTDHDSWMTWLQKHHIGGKKDQASHWLWPTAHRHPFKIRNLKLMSTMQVPHSDLGTNGTGASNLNATFEHRWSSRVVLWKFSKRCRESFGESKSFHYQAESKWNARVQCGAMFHIVLQVNSLCGVGLCGLVCWN